jgi:branched-chain amino acid transport system substrate-binding protein
MNEKSRSPHDWRRNAALAAVGAVVVAITGCGSTSPAADAGAPYKVGVLVGLTGSYAALGEPERQAIKLYFDKANNDGGINGKKVELVVLDTGSDEGNAVNQLRKLATQEKVHAVLGPSSSGEAIAVQSFAASLKVPVIALASSTKIVEPAEKSSYIFKQYTDIASSLRAQLEYAKEQGWNKIGILSTNDAAGQDPATRIDATAASVGVQIVGKESFNAKDTDVTAQLNKLGASGPDAVMVWAANPANAIVAKNAASIGYRPILFNSPGAGSSDYIKNAGTSAEKTLLLGSKVLAADSLAQDDPQYGATQTLVKEFTAAYNAPPGQYAANGWDGATLLASALRSAGGDPSNVQATRDGIRDAMENKTKSVVGVNSIYTFTPEYHGSVSLAGLAVLAVKDGKFVVEHAYK